MRGRLLVTDTVSQDIVPDVTLSPRRCLPYLQGSGDCEIRTLASLPWLPDPHLWVEGHHREPEVIRVDNGPQALAGQRAGDSLAEGVP